MIRDQMEKIYSETPPADIPWNLETPPKMLVELVESGPIQPCKTIDIGCGAGNYAISSEDELRDLFDPHFDVTSLETVEIEGEREPHRMNWAFMRKM